MQWKAEDEEQEWGHSHVCWETKSKPFFSLDIGTELPENVSRAEPPEQGDAVWNYGMPGLQGTLKLIPWPGPPSQVAQGPPNNPAHRSWACCSQAFLALTPNVRQKIPSRWGILWAKQEIPIIATGKSYWCYLQWRLLKEVSSPLPSMPQLWVKMDSFPQELPVNRLRSSKM